MGRQVEELRAPPKPTSEQDAQRLYTDPRSLIREEIDRAVAPLIEFVRGVKGDTSVERAKNQIRRDPRFASVFAEGEDYIDQALQVHVNAGKEVTPEMVMTIAAGVRGSMDMGLIPRRGTPPANNAPAPAPAAPAGGTMQPPYTPPSAPPANRPAAKKLRDLTELEKQVARSRNLTDEQYLTWLDMDASGVAYSEFGKEKK